MRGTHTNEAQNLLAVEKKLLRKVDEIEPTVIEVVLFQTFALQVYRRGEVGVNFELVQRLVVEPSAKIGSYRRVLAAHGVERDDICPAHQYVILSHLTDRLR
jgi:hypothetical protein